MISAGFVASNFERAARRVIPYASIYLIATVITFARQFIYADLLGPASYGEFATLVLFATSFLLIGDVGYSWTIQKRLPAALLNRDEAAADRMLHGAILAFSIVLLGGVILVIPILIVLGMATLTQLLFVTVFVVGQELFILHAIRIRSALATTSYAAEMLIRSVAIASVGTALVYVERSATAAMAGEALASLVTAAFLAWRQKWLRRILSTGAFAAAKAWLLSTRRAASKFLVLNGSNFVVASIDRWLGVWLLTRAEFGIYAVGAALLSAADVIQSMLNQYVFPVLARRVAAGDLRRAWRDALTMSLVVAAAGCLAILPVVVAGEWAVTRWIPQYEESVPVLKITVFASVLRVSNFMSGLGILLDREKALFKANVATVGVILLAAAGIVVSGYGIGAEMIAVGAVVGAGLPFVAAMLTVRSTLRTRLAGALNP